MNIEHKALLQEAQRGFSAGDGLGRRNYVRFLLGEAVKLLRRRYTGFPDDIDVPVGQFLSEASVAAEEVMSGAARTSAREKHAVELIRWVAEVARAEAAHPVDLERVGFASMGVGFAAAQLKLSAPQAAAQKTASEARVAWHGPAADEFRRLRATRPRITASKAANLMWGSPATAAPSYEALLAFLRAQKKDARLRANT